jgi:glycosyltransferase involved in cell wall biosynthesis
MRGNFNAECGGYTKPWCQLANANDAVNAWIIWPRQNVVHGSGSASDCHSQRNQVLENVRYFGCCAFGIISAIEKAHSFIYSQELRLMTRQQTVALCMIVKNEERNLPRCLNSITGLFDQIIVVDTGSTDRTVEIARAAQAEVYNFAWNDDFAAARNASLRQVRTDWVFWLDADDEIPQDQRPVLEALLDRLTDQPAIYDCWVKSKLLVADNSLTETVQIQQSRLFKFTSLIQWQRRIHEQIKPSCLTQKYVEFNSDLVIHHHGYEDWSIFQRKQNRDLRLLRMSYAVNPQDLPNLYYLARCLCTQGKYSEALTYLLQGYPQAQSCNENFVSLFYELLAICLYNHGHLDQSWNILQEGVTRFPDNLKITNLFAESLINKGHFSQVIAILHECLKHQDRNNQVQDVAQLVYLRINEARALALLGQHDQAERIFQEQLASYPTNIKLWANLAANYLDQQRYQDVEFVISQLNKLEINGQSYALVLSGIRALQQADYQTAIKLVEHAIVLNYDNLWARTTLLQILIQAQSQFPPEYLQIALREVLQRDPANMVALSITEQLNRQQAIDQGMWSSQVVMM